MAGKIFINYRRDDDPGYTQALYQRLEDEFASADLFMDVEGSIKPGDDFVEVLSTQVGACDVMLTIIGRRWCELLADRASDPADFVAIELKTAFAMGKRVIPVLVGGATMPGADELPEAIQSLARRNAVGLRPERFKADCQGLVTALKGQLADAEKERAARTEAQRVEAEARRLKREADEAARIAAAEDRARAQRIAGMSPEDVRKAEELANWEFIKERDQPQELLDHLARFPSGVTTRYARGRLEELVWDGIAFAPTAPTIETLQAFLNEFPDGKNADEARALLTDLERKAAAEAKATDEQSLARVVGAGWQETEAWVRVAASTERGSIEAFLSRWPQSHYASAARARIAELNALKKSTSWAHRNSVLISVGVMVASLLGVIAERKWHETLSAPSAAANPAPLVNCLYPPCTAPSLKTEAKATLPQAAAGMEVPPLAGFTGPPETTDAALQATPLWSVLKRAFPDWYAERLKEIAALAAQKQDDAAIGQQMAKALVALRRQNVNYALSASFPKIKAVAVTFYDNVVGLQKQSSEACFDFISQGEASPTIVTLLRGSPHVARLQAQLTAVFEAIADGRATPRVYPQPHKTDYDALASDLTRRGWTYADMQLFSDEQALAHAGATKVCQMVQDWFAAQLGVSDQDMQMRLLVDSLKPVIAG